jgi:hypothetical protein
MYELDFLERVVAVSNGMFETLSKRRLILSILRQVSRMVVNCEKVKAKK